MNRRERRAAAQGDQTKPAGSSASTPDALCEAGRAHLDGGRYLDAQLCCQQALAIDSDHADALHLMGLVSIQAQQYDHAVAWIARAIQQNPRPAYLSSLGTTLHRQGRFEEARQVFEKALPLQPDEAELWKNLGDVLIELQRLDAALVSLRKALQLNPYYADAAYLIAVIYFRLGKFEEALAHFDLCRKLQPDHALTLQLRGLSLRGLRRYEEFLADSRQAHALDPRNVETRNNIGDALQFLNCYEEALQWFDRALELQPNYIGVLINKASSLQQLHRFDEAAAIYQHIKAFDPDNADADWNLALLHMLTGHFESGWAKREARWRKTQPLSYPNISHPMWLGEEPVEGKTILVISDEGLGDAIQFARYVPMLADRGARVALLVQDALHPLLSAMPGVFRCFPGSAGASLAFDMHCPISSLPLAFRTRLDTIPAATSYLPPPPPERVRIWEDRLGARGRLRIGLVWSGSPTHASDHNRSIPLRMLSRIMEGVDATFVSLQKDPRPADRAVLAQTDIIDLTADLTDFAETAALISGLDLVISVDTSVAHLAAALGRPTWILLPYTPDYRWLLGRDDSPWYPTVRLFRQSEARDYRDVVERVRNELPAFVSKARRSDLTNLNGPTARLSGRQLHSQPVAADPDPSRLGTTLQQQGRLEEALDAFDKAIRLKADDTELWQKRGNVLVDLKRPADALLSFQHVLKLNPRHWDAASKCGIVLYKLGRLSEAHSYFELCHSLQPDHVPTLYMRGRALLDLGRLEEALADNQRAYALDPTRTEICNATGSILRSLGREQEALPWFDRAIALQPNSIEALNNRAVCLGQIQRFDEALATYARAKALDPENAEIDWNVSHLHMLTGNFEAGWAGREARWKRANHAPYPAFEQPKWLGQQPVDGKTILICSDEGLGDSIQFARYIPVLAERGAQIILFVSDPLVPLLSGLPGVSQSFPLSARALPAFDMHCPMGSLPLAFGTRLDTIPSPRSYLPAPAEARVRAWEDRLGPRNRLRVGLVWSGNPKHKNDRNRSASLRAFSRLLDTDASFVSLQKDPRPDDRAALRERTDIVDLTADLTDFAETAALVSCLDLIITVDTSVAHLAAALGRPTWILLPYTPDYRWLLGRDDSPWYPTVRLFRQSETREYDSVLDRVRSELQTLIAANEPAAQTDSGEAKATSPDALYAAGLHHMQAGRYREAQACCEQALARESDHADALHLLGRLAHQAEQYDHAVEWVARAIRQDPKPEYLSSLGSTLQRQGRLDEALQTFDKALQLKPDDAELWMSLGNVLLELKRSDEALLSFQRALQVDPRHWNAAHRSGFLLHQLGRPHEALSHLNLCDELQRDHSPTLQMRAICLCDLKRFDEGLIDIKRAQSLDSTNAGLSNNVGLVLKSLGRDEEALTYFDQALLHRPDYVAAFINKASSLHRLRRFDEALAIYEHVRTLDPANAEADLGLSFLYLLTGNLEAGWSLREARWKSEVRQAAYPKLSKPMWLGEEPIEGKTVLVYLDEGLGDTIQFVRYVPMLAARGARVILVVQDALYRLLSGLPGVSQCLPLSATGTLPAFDLHCSIMSLPLAFGTRLDTIPSRTGYLLPPAASHVQAWENRLGPRTRLRVGIVWSGNPAHDNDRNRSIPLRTFVRLLDLNATFVSLQKDPKADDQAILLERSDIIDLTGQLTDFADTAALISGLDLVITVDTSVAHLAGALGRPTWILLPYVPDWRWLLDRDDSPWYPTVRLFRQTETREYDSVLDRLRGELQALIAGR